MRCCLGNKGGAMGVYDYLIKAGYKPAKQIKQMDEWLQWYQGDVSNFHEYKVYNGAAFVQCRRDSMQMAKKVCEDWASLLLNEKTEIAAEDEAFKSILDEVLKYNSFSFRANQLIELVFALGTGAFVEYFGANQIPIIDYVRGDQIYPLSWDNGEITECAFASLRQEDGERCYYIAIHELDDRGQYLIRNRLINAQNNQDVALPSNVLPEVLTRSSVPRFQILQPNLVNNIDLDSPFGVSVLANNIGKLKKIDLIFDSGNNEFSLGRKRIILPLTMAQVKVGEAQGKPAFDPNDVAFYGLNLGGGSADAQKPIDLTGELRIEEHSKGLQDALNYLADGCGLGADRYESSRAGGVKTATEVISEKSALYQNLQKHKHVIEKAIKDLCRSLAVMLGKSDTIEISVNFDDSIIQDETAKKQQAMLEFQAGLIDEVQYHIDAYGLEPEVAAQKVAEIKKRMGETEDLTETVFESGDEGEDLEIDQETDQTDDPEDVGN